MQENSEIDLKEALGWFNAVNKPLKEIF